MLRRSFVLALAGLALASCSLPVLDKEADAKAKGLYEQIRTGANLSENMDLDQSLRTPDTVAALTAIKDSLPPGAPTATVNRGFNFHTVNGHTTAVLVHAYSYPTKTVVAETVLEKSKDRVWKITGFHVGFEEPGKAPAPKAPPPAVTVEKTVET